MSPFSRFTDWFKRGRQLPQGQVNSSTVLEDLLGARARHLHAADPETARQWQYLNVVLQSGRAAEEKRVRPRAFRLLSPATSFGSIAVIVLIVAGVLWLSRSSLQTYETGMGQRSSITLSDSSEVTLNHTSTLVVEARGASHSKEKPSSR